MRRLQCPQLTPACHSVHWVRRVGPSWDVGRVGCRGTLTCPHARRAAKLVGSSRAPFGDIAGSPAEQQNARRASADLGCVRDCRVRQRDRRCWCGPVLFASPALGPGVTRCRHQALVLLDSGPGGGCTCPWPQRPGRWKPPPLATAAPRQQPAPQPPPGPPGCARPQSSPGSRPARRCCDGRSDIST